MSDFQTQHLSEEQQVAAYYGEYDASEHLRMCPECRREADRLRDVLDAVSHYPIPQRSADYGSGVWTRLLPKLPSKRPQRLWLRWWVLTPAFATVLLMAFVTGRLIERGHPAGISTKARERVLLMSLSDHLEQSQIVLANVANADTEAADLTDERDRAHELLGANRLLRQAATRLGDSADAALLDELERVLLDVANGPGQRSFADLERTQRQIKQDGLLFRVRVTSMVSREKGEKL